ncbi:MAG: hypothetical protein ACRD1K_08505 [Acidimicrobiales bacterium]
MATAPLGDLFPRLDILPAAARRQLARLLAVPGGSPALLPRELATLPLPATTAARQALCRLIEAALGPAELAALGRLSPGQVVPPIRGRRGKLSTARP